jgi:penicillin-binding protein 1B
VRTRRVVIFGISIGISPMLILSGVLFLTTAFGAYLSVLYRQLLQNFDQQQQHLPMRIFSDVTRIAPPQSREYVESRLKALGYSVEKLDEGALKFRLRSTSLEDGKPLYPPYLLPEAHPTLEAGEKPIVLKFDGVQTGALLQSVEVAESENNLKEIPEVFLEPELIATVSRGGAGDPNESSNYIRAVAKFEEIPPKVWRAIIAVEDPHFLEHKGLDPRGFARALWTNLRTLSLAQGGSTISMQLVKNLSKRRGKNVFLKANEILLTLLLEMKMDKEVILERYLNEVYLGQVGSFEVHGVVEGARHFFGKSLEDLNQAEAALMAGVIRGPHYYSPYRDRAKERALERERWVLKRMVETGHLTEEEEKEALASPIRLAPVQTSTNKAPYFTDYVKAELLTRLKGRMSEEEITDAGFRVYTTLDPFVNAAAQKAVARGIETVEKRLKLQPHERLEGALAAVNHTDGAVKALIGGRSYAQSTFNRILNMRRQVGSTFKPFVYLAALEKGADANNVPYGPGYPVEDLAWTLKFDQSRQKWTPRNYEKTYLGWTNMRTALAHSVNTVAARLGQEVGVANIILTARSLGISSELPQVPSLSLGVAELSPMELLRAYATIANHGVQDELTVIRGITQDDGTGVARFFYHPKQVFNPGPTDLLTEMMQSVLTEGTARAAAAMGFDRHAAGKTGTTSNYRDAWFAGYTPSLTAVVWVGMDQTPVQVPVEGEDVEEKDLKKDLRAKKEVPKPTKVILTGSGAALPIWVDFMKAAHENEPPTPFAISPHLVDVTIDKMSGQRANSACQVSQVTTEKYLKAHEPSEETCATAWPASISETVTN